MFRPSTRASSREFGRRLVAAAVLFMLCIIFVPQQASAQGREAAAVCDPATPPAVVLRGLKERVAFGRQEEFSVEWTYSDEAEVDSVSVSMRDAATGDSFFFDQLLEDDLGEYFIQLEREDGPSEVRLEYVEFGVDGASCLRTVSRVVRPYTPPPRNLSERRAVAELARVARQAGQGAFVTHGDWEGACRRISSRRMRCRAGGFLGDVVYGLQGKVWLTGRGEKERISHSLTSKRVNEYCVHVTRAGNCVDRRRHRGSRRF